MPESRLCFVHYSTAVPRYVRLLPEPYSTQFMRSEWLHVEVRYIQTDMHYYGTYALARCAGFRDDIALAIATAAEFVDDSDYVDVTLMDGVKVKGNPTAHH